ncbi:MAG: hypothetical protein WDN67_05305 [Candidatus Moraniibacteriota bacterium]
MNKKVWSKIQSYQLIDANEPDWNLSILFRDGNYVRIYRAHPWVPLPPKIIKLTFFLMWIFQKTLFLSRACQRRFPRLTRPFLGLPLLFWILFLLFVVVALGVEVFVAKKMVADPYHHTAKFCSLDDYHPDKYDPKKTAQALNAPLLIALRGARSLYRGERGLQGASVFPAA